MLKSRVGTWPLMLNPLWDGRLPCLIAKMKEKRLLYITETQALMYHKRSDQLIDHLITNLYPIFFWNRWRDEKTKTLLCGRSCFIFSCESRYDHNLLVHYTHTCGINCIVSFNHFLPTEMRAEGHALTLDICTSSLPTEMRVEGHALCICTSSLLAYWNESREGHATLDMYIIFGYWNECGGGTALWIWRHSWAKCLIQLVPHGR